MMSEPKKYQMDDLLRQRVKDASASVPHGMWEKILDARRNQRYYPVSWMGFSAMVLVTAAFAGWVTFGENRTHNDLPLEKPGVEQARESLEQPTASIRTAEEDLQKGHSSASEADRGGAETPAQDVRQKAAGHRSMPDRASAGTGQIEITAGKAVVRQEESRTSSATRDRGISTSEALIPGMESSFSPSLRDENQVLARSKALTEDWTVLGSKGPSEVVAHAQGQADLPVPPFMAAQQRRSSPSCYSFHTFLRGLSVDGYLAPEYALRQLVYKEPGMGEYAAMRDETESYSFAFSAGFRANAHFKGGLALRTGVVYTDIVEKFRNADPDAEVRRIITVNIDTIYNPPDVIINVDTLSIVEYGAYDKVGYNRYRFYDVPLLLGYELDRGRWIVHINTGLMLNIGTARRGQILDPQSNLVSIHSGENSSYPAFRSKVGSSLLMSLGFNYAVRPKLHLLLEPQFRVWMKPLNLEDYPVDQKYMNIGLAMGVRQYF